MPGNKWQHPRCFSWKWLARCPVVTGKIRVRHFRLLPVKTGFRISVRSTRARMGGAGARFDDSGPVLEYRSACLEGIYVR